MNDDERTPRGRYSRGYLPHMDLGSVPQFVTWRLADSIPESLIAKWELELRHEKDSRRKLEMYRRVEHYLDQGHGCCILRNPAAARIVQAKLLEHHRIEYELHEWVIMPNHVHVLLTPAPDHELGPTIGMLKGRTSHDINAMLGRSGRLWQPDYFDRFMRDERHFEARRVIFAGIR